MNGWLEIWRQQLDAGFAWLNEDREPFKRGERVRLIRRVGDSMSVMVDHPEHGQHTVACSSLSMPREFKTAKGRWIPESDPRVETFLLKALDDLRSGGKKIQSSSDPDLRRRTEEELLWLLERNGWAAEIKLPGLQVEGHEIWRGQPGG